MNTRKSRASLWLAICIAVVSIPAQAQVGPPAGVGNLEDRVTKLELLVTALQVALKNEITAREAGDLSLSLSLRTALDNEAALRAAEDDALKAAFAEEARVRSFADIDLLNHIKSEAAARETADMDLRAQIAGGGIPGLKDYLTVFTDQTTGYPTVLFKGANVQVVNGLGITETINGLGNLIVGYNGLRNVAPAEFVCSDGQFADQAACEGAGQLWAANHKSGSHNIVGGQGNSYSSYGGLVVGISNVTNGQYSSVTGGSVNTASGFASSVSGGFGNGASGLRSSVSGGQLNTASASNSSVSGGTSNFSSGSGASVSGGQQNTASAGNSSVSGGVRNTASKSLSSVSGGADNTASGNAASLSGGQGCTEAREVGWSVGDTTIGTKGCATGN